MVASRKGYTLIELLVVIAVIGILSTIMMLSLNKARAKARDAKRLSDIYQLQLALELYASDHELSRPYEYPISGAAVCSLSLGNTCYYASNSSWIAGLIPKYTTSLPLDPAGYPGPEPYKYKRDPNYGYVLTFKLERGPQQDKCGLAGTPASLSTACGRVPN